MPGDFSASDPGDGGRRARLWWWIVVALVVILVPTVAVLGIIRHLSSAVPGALSEASGMILDPRHPERLWAIADSGHAAVLSQLDRRGQLVREVEVVGARNHDWEAMARDDQGFLYIGDTGHWRKRRPDCRYEIYRVPVPSAGTTQVAAERWDVIYPESYLRGRRCPNAEALFWMAGQLYLIGKVAFGEPAPVFRVPKEPGDQLQRRLLPVAELPAMGSWWRRRLTVVTGASFHSQRALLAVSSYTGIAIYRVVQDEARTLRFEGLRHIPLAAPTLGQCESVAWVGDDLILGNEQGQIFEFSRASWLADAKDGQLELQTAAP